MIRKTLQRTKDATYVIKIPDVKNKNFPTPSGTGFFISKDGYLITAHHVVSTIKIGESIDIERPSQTFFELVQGVELIEVWPQYDLALLKANFEMNKNKDSFKDKNGFPFIEIDLSDQEEAAPIYSFGYPLMESELSSFGDVAVGFTKIPSRITSAIISSTNENFSPIQSSANPKFYVIDKALNYGNSGGPIVSVETGKVFSVCTRFQPLAMKKTNVIIPSLYGITSSLQNIQTRLLSLQ